MRTYAVSSILQVPNSAGEGGHTLHVKQWQGLLDTTLATQFLVVVLVAVNFTQEVGGWDCVKAASRLHSRADLHLQQRLNCGLACFQNRWHHGAEHCADRGGVGHTHACEL
jgi:hypothetical protein